MFSDTTLVSGLRKAMITLNQAGFWTPLQTCDLAVRDEIT